MIIESTANPFVKQVKKLKEKKNRKAEMRYVIEGVNVTLEFLTHMPGCAADVIATPERAGEIPNKFAGITHIVSERVFAYLSDTKSPQGMMAVGKIVNQTPDFSDMHLLVYLDNVQDPGNVGTIIRTADAFGADAVILSPESADIYNSKTVRSAMGSLFHLPVLYEEEYLSLAQKLKKDGFSILTGSLDATSAPSEIDFSHGKNMICLGNEAHGVSDELVSVGVKKIKIPMPGKAESLNVAVAGAVLLYESVRQRGAI